MAIGPYGVSPFLMRSLHTVHPAVAGAAFSRLIYLVAAVPVLAVRYAPSVWGVRAPAREHGVFGRRVC
eukprot:COSAG04_NODE_713_length_10870_cov_3.260050_11_plen_68_part_00